MELWHTFMFQFNKIETHSIEHISLRIYLKSYFKHCDLFHFQKRLQLWLFPNGVLNIFDSNCCRCVEQSISILAWWNVCDLLNRKGIDFKWKLEWTSLWSIAKKRLRNVTKSTVCLENSIWHAPIQWKCHWGGHRRTCRNKCWKTNRQNFHHLRQISRSGTFPSFSFHLRCVAMCFIRDTT